MLSVAYISVGVLIGFLAGIFGIGGSMIATPILKVLFGIPDFIAIASPLPVTIPTAISGAFGYWRKGLVHKKTALLTVITGLPATIIGAYATKFIHSFYLMLLTGIFLFLVGWRLLRRDSHSNYEFKTQIPISIVIGLVGFISGFFSGLLAVGGGFILVPAYVLLLGLSMQEAAATSLLCVAFFAIPGTFVHWWLGHINWHLVLNISFGVIPAGYFGSQLAMRAKSKQLQLAFSIFLIIFSIYFILSQ